MRQFEATKLSQHTLSSPNTQERIAVEFVLDPIDTENGDTVCYREKTRLLSAFLENCTDQLYLWAVTEFRSFSTKQQIQRALDGSLHVSPHDANERSTSSIRELLQSLSAAEIERLYEYILRACQQDSIVSKFQYNSGTERVTSCGSRTIFPKLKTNLSYLRDVMTAVVNGTDNDLGWEEEDLHAYIYS